VRAASSEVLIRWTASALRSVFERDAVMSVSITPGATKLQRTMYYLCFESIGDSAAQLHHTCVPPFSQNSAINTNRHGI
jgi:hypothetical protein